MLFGEIKSESELTVSLPLVPGPIKNGILIWNDLSQKAKRLFSL